MRHRNARTDQGRHLGGLSWAIAGLALAAPRRGLQRLGSPQLRQLRNYIVRCRSSISTPGTWCLRHDVVTHRHSARSISGPTISIDATGSG